MQLGKTDTAGLVEVAVGVSAPGGAVPTAVDAVAFHNLASVQAVEVKQGNALWEAATGGCAPNTFMVRDTASGTPIFIMEEKSSCWMRCCCNGCQPLYVKFYNTEGPYQVPAKTCCGMFTLQAAHDRYKKNGEAVMTLERPGFTEKCCFGGACHCCVCFECCQAESFVHAGDVGNDDGSTVTKAGDKPTAFSHSIVPIGGGGLTPTVNIMGRDPSGAETPFGVVEGPTLFGGCMDLLIDTHFTVSKEKGKSGDIAMIKKKARDEGCMGLCKALFTSVDTYDLTFNDPNMTPQQKATVIAEAVALDYMFFDQEQPLCRYNNDTNNCEILMCLCYCFGCLIPCKCILPCGKGD